jgi:hypothetical protein
MMLARLEVLLGEYPFLSGRGAVLPIVIAVFAPLSAAGHGSRSWEFVYHSMLCGCYLALLVSTHYYDLARQRVQGTSQGVVTVRREFCFASTELQEAFESWKRNRVLPLLLDAVQVAFIAVFAVKLIKHRAVCGLFHQFLALGGPMTAMPRALHLKKLSSWSHSTLSMMGFTYSWAMRCVVLWSGDECVVASCGGHLYAASMPVAVATSIIYYLACYILTPVSPAFFPYKMVTGLIGHTLVGYLHILRREEGIDWTVDSDRWGLLMLLFAHAFTSLVIFGVHTILCEMNMREFLSAVASQADVLDRRVMRER